MAQNFNLSPDLRNFLARIERTLGIEVILHRENDAPREGLLLDDFTFGSGKTVIVFPSSLLGMLKDYVITENAIRMLMKGMAAKNDSYRLLSFNAASARFAMEQIYLDALKDENTRNMEVWRKKKLLFYLFILFNETMNELPWTILSNIIIMKQFPAMRNSQAYFLIKESMKDMHSLVSVKDFLPQRYFVMHNAMYYARDFILAYAIADVKLNPVINIPELQKFKNLDMKEMMTHRWSRSAWYHTKMVGDAMANLLKVAITIDPERVTSPEHYREVYECGAQMTNRWLSMTGMENWYRWETSEQWREAMKGQDAIESAAQREIFGD